MRSAMSVKLRKRNWRRRSFWISSPAIRSARRDWSAQYNTVLRGKDGFKRVIVNSLAVKWGSWTKNRRLPETICTPRSTSICSVPPKTTIGDHTGAAVALDPHTGEILAMVSKPAFDPNLFATRISRADWNSLINDPRKPLQNRVIQSHYSPGSVFKVFMAAAGLEAGTSESAAKRCIVPGTRRSTVTRSPATSKRVMERSSLHDAIVSSCNVFFYNVGKDLGIDRISQYATMMGLGRKTGIDLPNEDAGLIPSRNGSSAFTRRSGMPAKRFRSRSDRATSASRRCRRHGRWADWRPAAG